MAKTQFDESTDGSHTAESFSDFEARDSEMRSLGPSREKLLVKIFIHASFKSFFSKTDFSSHKFVSGQKLVYF